MADQPDVTGFFHKQTGSITYVVADPATKRAAIVDSVLDFDQAAGRTATVFADAVAEHVRQRGLTVDWLLETHCHADHLSAAPHLRSRLGGQVAIGNHIDEVQRIFSRLYNIDLPALMGFDRLFAEGDTFKIGGIEGRVMHTPGHTPACVTYVIGDAAFCGDTLFMPDYGTARCDFPGGSAETLYRSIRRILDLPEDTRIFTAHDYQPDGRPPAWTSTVGQQRRANKHVRDGVSEAEFVQMRKARDATLSMPQLLWPSVQVNINAGQMPRAEGNGLIYLKVPINAV
ncbi:MAG: MBL fold metallo-hydrolase [Rhodospirillales bacterium]|nr:MBL fold metallo-hydrolase [Rhodospirillales bacterium]